MSIDKNKLILPTTILLASIILGSFYYVSQVNKQKYIEKQIELQTKNEQEKNAQAEKEKEVQEILKIQQEELEKRKKEIGDLKQKQTEQENKPAQIIMKETTKEIHVNTNEINSPELNQYLEAVVSIDCFEASGSGFLWKFLNNNYSIITNRHVVESCRESSDFGCWCWATANNIKGDGIALLRMQINLNPSLNSTADIKSSIIKTNGQGNLEDLNYKLSSVSKCPNLMSIGSPVVVIGYPAFAVQPNEVGNLKYERITSYGKISGYAEIDLITKESLSVANYYISATIDSGNSGGIALSKNKDGLCLLGVPTWLKLGNYETQGVVQNMNNIFK